MSHIKFTARGIAALKVPSKGRLEYWDSDREGFGIRVTEKGAKSWFTMYWHKGRLRRHTLGRYPNLSLADAYEKASEARNSAAKGNDPAAEKKAQRLADTFGELAETYMKEYAIGPDLNKPKKKSWKMDQYIIDQDLLSRWKNKKAKEIKKADVRELVRAVVNRGAEIHANRVFALVRKIFNFAVSEDLVEYNPCAALKQPTKARSRDRVLSVSEIRSVWLSSEQEDKLTAAMFKLRLLTAQRGGEVESIAWDDLDLNSSMWTIPASRAKNGLSHRVPLSPQVLQVFKSLTTFRCDSPWVFPSPVDKKKHIENVQKAIQRVRNRKDLNVDFRGHDLRRTAASYMASMGVSRLVISKILNHVEKGITSVYDRHSYDAEKREALDAWGKRLEEILSADEKQVFRADIVHS